MEILGIDIETIAAVIGSILVAAKALLVAADKIVGLTPGNSDDETLEGIRRVFAKIVKLADRLSLNPDNVKARPAKQPKENRRE